MATMIVAALRVREVEIRSAPCAYQSHFENNPLIELLLLEW